MRPLESKLAQRSFRFVSSTPRRVERTPQFNLREKFILPSRFPQKSGKGARAAQIRQIWCPSRQIRDLINPTVFKSRSLTPKPFRLLIRQKWCPSHQPSTVNRQKWCFHGMQIARVRSKRCPLDRPRLAWLVLAVQCARVSCTALRRFR